MRLAARTDHQLWSQLQRRQSEREEPKRTEVWLELRNSDMGRERGASVVRTLAKKRAKGLLALRWSGGLGASRVLRPVPFAANGSQSNPLAGADAGGRRAQTKFDSPAQTGDARQPQDAMIDIDNTMTRDEAAKPCGATDRGAGAKTGRARGMKRSRQKIVRPGLGRLFDPEEEARKAEEEKQRQREERERQAAAREGGRGRPRQTQRVAAV